MGNKSSTPVTRHVPENRKDHKDRLQDRVRRNACFVDDSYTVITNDLYKTLYCPEKQTVHGTPIKNS